MKKTLFAFLFFALTSIGFAQDTTDYNEMLKGVFPKSYDYSSEISLYSYDDIEHRSIEHYKNLKQIILKELSIPDSGLGNIYIVFINDNWYNTLLYLNYQLRMSEDWQAITFNKSGLIFILNSAESDVTFFHEMTHVLFNFNRIDIQQISYEKEELIAIFNSKMLLGSKSYLEYINELSKEGIR